MEEKQKSQNPVVLPLGKQSGLHSSEQITGVGLSSRMLKQCHEKPRLGFSAHHKVSGNRWIAKRANHETKNSQGASTARLTKPKLWQKYLGFLLRHSARPKKVQKVSLTCSIVIFWMGSGPPLLCQPFSFPAPRSRALDVAAELGLSC